MDKAPTNPGDILALWPLCHMFYTVSMRFITQSALRSVDAVGADIERAQGDFSRSDQNSTLNHLQNIVGMGAALSRYFWPVRAGHDKRGTLLRERYEVTDSSPLKSRELRNEIEHFDEKLDVYLSKGIVGVIIPHYIGPFHNDGGVPSHLFRAYYTDQGVFEILDRRFHIPPPVDEIARIDDLLQYSKS